MCRTRRFIPPIVGDPGSNGCGLKPRCIISPTAPVGPFWSVNGNADIMALEARPDIFSSSHEFGGITVVDLFG